MPRNILIVGPQDDAKLSFIGNCTGDFNVGNQMSAVVRDSDSNPTNMIFISESNKKPADKLYQGANAIILNFDLCSRESYEQSKNMIDKALSLGANKSIFFLGSISSPEHRQQEVTTEEFQGMINEMSQSYNQQIDGGTFYHDYHDMEYVKGSVTDIVNYLKRRIDELVPVAHSPSRDESRASWAPGATAARTSTGATIGASRSAKPEFKVPSKPVPKPPTATVTKFPTKEIPKPPGKATTFPDKKLPKPPKR